jgi:hypothetical protein
MSVRRRRWNLALAGMSALCLFAATKGATAQGMPVAEPPTVPPVAQPQPAQPQSGAAATQPAPAPVGPSLLVNTTPTYQIFRDAWSDADERGYAEFIAAIGNANCRTVDQCMKNPANPFARTDRPGVFFKADCADLPYFLRAYYAWKRGLPFSYIAAVSPRGSTRDIRYTASGNSISHRRDVLTNSTSGLTLLVDLRNGISSAMYRLHPDMENTDLYPVRIDRKALRAGSVLYDPNGHLAVVYKIEDDGRILYIDAHPDNTLTRGTYGRKFVRSSPGMGSGFKNWRPARLVNATKTAEGVLLGGTVVLAKNAEVPDYSTEQYFGNVARPGSDRQWASGAFLLEGQQADYYDYLRAKMGGGSLAYEPVQELRNMMRANCEDIKYRAEAVDIAIARGIHLKGQPSRLPPNIYGTEGEWEDFSSPSRDARLKTSFKELRDQVQRFVEWHGAGDRRIQYAGGNLLGDLLGAYDQEANACTISYMRSNGTPMVLGYEEIRRRLFLLSFDPYHCVERRWGASDPVELSSCRDDNYKAEWYAAEQHLRNQIDRPYDARMDFGLAELKQGPGPGKGVAQPPDIDARGYIMNLLATRPAQPAPAGYPGVPAAASPR